MKKIFSLVLFMLGLVVLLFELQDGNGPVQILGIFSICLAIGIWMEDEPLRRVVNRKITGFAENNGRSQVFKIPELEQSLYEGALRDDPYLNNKYLTALSLQMMDDFAGAIEILQSCLRQNSFSFKNTVALTFEIARNYQFMNQSVYAVSYYNKSLVLSKRMKNVREEALVKIRVYNNLALLEQADNNPRRSLYLYDLAERMAMKFSYQKELARAINGKAGLYRSTGNNESANVLYDKAISLYRDQDDRAGEALALYNMALVYRNMGHSFISLPLFEQSLELLENSGIQYLISGVKKQIAEITKDRNELESASGAFNPEGRIYALPQYVLIQNNAERK